MKHKTLFRHYIKAIKQSKGRFLSLMSLAFLGTFGLVGLKVTGPNMNETVQQIVSKTNMADIMVISSLGLNQTDVSEITQLDDAISEFGYFMDASISTNQFAIRLFSHPVQLSTPQLIEGRTLKADDEIVISDHLKSEFPLNSLITVQNHKSEDTLVHHTFKVVGYVQTSEFLSTTNLGSSTAGNGSLTGFAYINRSNFNQDVYTIARISYPKLLQYNALSHDYQQLINENKQQLTQLLADNKEIRFNEVVEKANDEIDNQRLKITDAKQQLVDGEQKIESAKIDIQKGFDAVAKAENDLKTKENDIALSKKELAQNHLQLLQTEKQLLEAKTQIEQGKAKLDEKRNQLNDALSQIQDGFSTIEMKRPLLVSSIQQAESGLTQFQSVLTETETHLKQLKIEKSQLEQTDENQAALNAINEKISALSIQKNHLLGQITTLTEELKALNDYVKSLDSEKSQLQIQKDTVSNGLHALNEQAAILDEKQKDYLSGLQQFNTGKSAWQKGSEDLKSGENKLNEGKSQLITKKRDLINAQEQLDQEAADFQHKKIDDLKEIADGEQQIAEASDRINALTLPTYAIYTRETMLGSEGLSVIKATSDGISAVSNLFPMVLYGVALLVSLTTMTRFVSEERLNAGILKALGFTNQDIIKKFMLYGFFSSAIGALLGILAGNYGLPYLLGKSLLKDSILPNIVLPFHASIAFWAFIIAVGCTVIPAYLVAKKDLSEQASSLLLPKPPVKGSKIWLEWIPIIWNKLSFTRKITARNLFRYKLRMIMTVFGVASSMALLFSGLGILSSLDGMSTRQFNAIVHFDALAIEKDYVTDEEKQSLTQMLQHDNIKSVTPYYLKNVRIAVKNTQNDQLVTLFVGENTEPYLSLIDASSGKALNLTHSGVIITQKLSNLLNVTVGDSVTLSIANEKPITIVIENISEMYAGHYIFFTPTYYQTVTNESISSNGYLLQFTKNDFETVDKIGTLLLNEKAIATVAHNSTLKQQVNTLVDSLTKVMLILVFVSLLLAFVILYNLNTINVAERLRELSTVKVLGFFNHEVTLYIYRETMLLSLFGIILGVFGGKVLHRIIIESVATPQMMFNPSIEWWVYIVPALIMVLLILTIGLIMYRHLKKIDMLEALKSVD